MCRSRRELSNEYLVAKIGVDTAENEPSKVDIMDNENEKIPVVHPVIRQVKMANS